MALRQVSRCLRTAQSGQSVTKSLRQQHTAASPLAFLDSPRPPFRDDYSQAACDARRVWVEHRTGASLRTTGQWMEDIDTTIFKGNIEMPMGLVKLPVACVGPLTIHGEDANGEFIGPFATTEGALTASMQRGVIAVNAGSGAITRTGKQFCSRGPCFVTKSAAQAQMLGNWVKSKKEILRDEVVGKVSSHAKLEDIMPVYDFEGVHIVFLFSTGDACGQNVATVCSAGIVQWIMDNYMQEIPEVNIRRAWVEANATSDKKPGAFNILHGRGMSTEAKTILPEPVLNKHLNVSGEELLEFYHYASRMSMKTTSGGGFQANPSNTLTALYIATGQDPACVTDSCAGTDLTLKKNDGEGGGVVATLSLQNLLVGTVGGGTALPTQKEALDMLDCRGAGKVRKFAEIATAFSLALDLSTITAVCAGKFASGHDKLGRNRPSQTAAFPSS